VKNSQPFLVVVICLATTYCGPKQPAEQVAVFTQQNAYEVLSLAYAAEAARIYSKHCTAYECQTDTNCPALDRCPELVDQTERWKSVWHAHDLLTTAIELGSTEEAARLYCELVKVAPAPLPKGTCTK
jgi:hypothetical protein